MSFLKKLFGGGASTQSEAEAEVYKGFAIKPTPISEGGSYRVCAVIEKEIEGEMKRHELVRADTVQGLEAAQTASVGKAKQLIDEQGDRLFR